MIKVEVRKNNSIIELTTPGKSPIRSSNGLYFWSSMELICAALGSCFGRHLMWYCREEHIDPALFEEIVITMENFIPHISIKHPSNMDVKILDEIKSISEKCEVSALLLKTPPTISFHLNSIPDEVLLKEKKGGGCCGGT